METVTTVVPQDRPATLDDVREVELVRRAQTGDVGAFEALLDGRLASTFRTAMAILGDEHDAREATQAVFVRAWQSLPSLRETNRFSAWFGRIVVNTCRSTLRGRRRRAVREIPVSALGGQHDAELTLESLESLRGSSGARADDPAARLARIDALERAFDGLSEAERVVVWQHYYEGRPLAEIAATIGVPVSTVKSRLFTARRALERELEAQDR